MNKRSVILTTCIVFCFVALFLRLVTLMLFNHRHYMARASIQHTQELEIQKRRGIIFDRRGKELAVNVEQRSLYVDPRMVEGVHRTAQELSRLTGVERQSMVKKLGGGKRFVWVRRKLDHATAEKIERAGLRGIGFVPEPDRVYPGGMLASHVVGFVDIDNNGLAGVELEYDRQLASRGGKVRVGTDARGNILLAGNELEMTGNSVVLTIDEVVQFIAETALDRAMAKWRAKSATVIMMNPYSGEILAMANRPAFNANTAGRFPESSRRNAAITDVYEPGSTFKIVTAAAVLEEDLFRPESTFDCSRGYIEVGGKRIRDDHKHKVLSLTEVIQKSSNIGTILMAQHLGKEKLYQYAKRYGFGERTGIDLPGEVQGWIREPAQWSGTSLGAVPIGHEIAVTPLQVLRAYAAIANGGYLVAPFVVSRVISPEGAVLFEKEAGAVKRIISSRTALMVKEMLETVTMTGGTATEASLEGNSVAGKTGTAQVYDGELKRYSRQRYVSSFAGFFPSDRPRVAMIVTISEPVGEIFGGKVAGPVFREIAEKTLAYMNVPMDRSPAHNVVNVKVNHDPGRYH